MQLFTAPTFQIYLSDLQPIQTWDTQYQSLSGVLECYRNRPNIMQIAETKTGLIFLKLLLKIPVITEKRNYQFTIEFSALPSIPRPVSNIVILLLVSSRLQNKRYSGQFQGSMKHELQGNWQSPWKIEDTISKIKFLLDTHHIHTTHCMREANKVADKLASLNHKSGNNCIYTTYSSLPRQIIGLVNIDRWQIPSFKVRKRNHGAIIFDPP
ncbi:hypothetical protein H5410_017088 [Solanum commersonii]|uniref:RNase H type-1 domain-containing protein n=1 Tax=Solanum commersonii TaxID=4109 RepID=A0A9J5ZYE2_SOLCO|nr:hypothetical protein H5410_017088 [Solanum commersonii]